MLCRRDLAKDHSGTLVETRRALVYACRALVFSQSDTMPSVAKHYLMLGGYPQHWADEVVEEWLHQKEEIRGHISPKQEE